MTRHQRQITALTFAVLLLLLSCCSHLVESWGPLTHQSWACQMLLLSSEKNSFSAVNANVRSCYQTNDPLDVVLDKKTSFVLGGSSPDAVKQLSMRLHSFEFAAYQYEYALMKQRQQRQSVKKNKNKNKTVDKSGFDPVAFSLAYGNHLAQDVVGHWKTGYLTPEYDHPIEFAADTFQFYTEYKPNNFTFFPLVRFDADAIDFLTEANEYFANKTSKPFVPFTRDGIRASIQSFERMVMAEVAAAVLNIIYKDQMVAFDFCKTNEYKKALAHLTLSQEWSDAASKFWMDMNKKNPESVESQVRLVVEQLYATKNGTICEYA